MHNERMLERSVQTGFPQSADRLWPRRRRGSRMSGWACLALAGLSLLLAQPAQAAREVKTDDGKGAGDIEARRLFDKATDLLTAGDSERGLKMFETIIEQYPASKTRFSAYLSLGRYYASTHEETKAIGYLNNLKQLETAAGVVAVSEREVFLEGMYLLSTAYFQIRNYGAAFPILRKITTGYANTAWANQAYYYIGLCHFMQQNWSKAIEALNMVGTFVDVDDPNTALVEAGRRLYIKVNDNDLSVLTKLGRRTFVDVETTHGDREKVECLPLSADNTLLIGSIASEVATPKTNNNVLEVYGGDEITVRYTDVTTKDGAANVPRERKVKVVSTGGVKFTQGNYEAQAVVAFLGQPLFISVFDADLDTSDAAETVSVKVIARYKEKATEETVPGAGIDVGKALEENTAKQYRIRDEVIVRLRETGNAPVHTGRFLGSLVTQEETLEAPANTSDDVLSCKVDDEIIVTYTDELHIFGATPRISQSTMRMAGQIDNHPVAIQDIVTDPVVKARKSLVESSAYLELARIFKSVGLMAGAKLKAAEGLDRTDAIIRTKDQIPSELRQQAIKIKWELQIAEDNLGGAIATCGLFNQLFPDSPMVDEALMGIARIRLENKNYAEAISVLQQILALPKSQVKAEAQFLIAESTETMGFEAVTGNSQEQRDSAMLQVKERAVAQYKMCADRYPESEFAGRALAKMIDFQIETKNYPQANELLVQIFQDYPDAAFLDGMLLKWVLLSYSSGDYAKARDKCTQLLFEYPGSAYAEKARQVLPKIEEKLKGGSGGSGTAGAAGAGAGGDK